MKKREITLIYNPKSGSSPSLQELKKKCGAHHLTIAESLSVTAKNFQSKLAHVIKNGKTIAVVGGDGTVSSVAGKVAGSKAVLAPLPGGTLNHFTKDLGISQDIDEALRKLSSAKKESIDIASVNDIFFVNNSSIGIYPHSLTTRENIKSYVSKWPAAAYAVVMAFIKFKLYTVTINNKKPFKTPFIFIGNNLYNINNNGFTDRKDINKGVLCVYTIKTTKRITFAKLFLAATSGKLHDTVEFEAFTASSLQIDAAHKKQVLISYDGEVSTQQNPLEYKINKKALSILR